MMEIRPYITFDGECTEALALYKRAFHCRELQIMHFRDLPQNPQWAIPEAYMDRVVQATVQFGENFIRMSDCGPAQQLHAPESQRISISVETGEAEVRNAFAVLAERGRIDMALSETFYSPCAGVVFDQFGVMWHLVARK